MWGGEKQGERIAWGTQNHSTVKVSKKQCYAHTERDPLPHQQKKKKEEKKKKEKQVGYAI